MTVKEIIMLACEMIEEDKVAEKLENGEVLSEDEELMKNALLKCFNFIQNEIATEFVPLVQIERIKANNHAFEIANLKKRLAYVISFKDDAGKNIQHKIVGDKIVFDGEGKIEYCYCPKKKGIADVCEIPLPERVIACGILREYYLLQGLANEATIFETKFKNSLANFASKKTSTFLPKPLWN